ncbi:MAG: glycosyltransferase [Hyphomicrobiaceae bacterium]
MNLPDLTTKLAWLREFERTHGRRLRVLHIGNIAANGYLNAKFLRRYGVEADVMSRDYYHVMALPEWEDLDIQQPHGDDNDPRFAPSDLKGYRRPDWFFVGPLPLCAELIENRYAPLPGLRHAFRRRVLSATLTIARRFAGDKTGSVLALAPATPAYFLKRAISFALLRIKPALIHLYNFAKSNAPPPLRSIAGKVRRFLSEKRKRSKLVNQLGTGSSHPQQLAASGEPPSSAVTSDPTTAILAAFDRVFPQRADRLTAAEIQPHQATASYFERICRHYDIVQCYATEPIFAMLCGKHPYVAFEHGTLRDFTLADTPLARLNSLAYNQASHCFITNGDCLEYAQKIGVRKFTPMPHPIDVEQHRMEMDQEIGRMRRSFGADVVLFCPVRHDYAVKGTDVHVRAIPLIKDRLKAQGKTVKWVFISWGQQVAESRRMIAEFECEENVIWRTSMSRLAMIKHIRGSDVVLDQMALPHFGSTAPQCLAAGTPVISSYEPSSTAWMFPEPAPILPAFDERGIADAVGLALDSTWKLGYSARARAWMDQFHSPAAVVAWQLEAYQKALSDG